MKKLTINELIDQLKDISKIPDSEWQESLNERKKRELEFHDRDRDRKKLESIDK